jgi:ppGpp synthetase/RelA/SpoT-type nucleotidyltranferase
VTKETKDYSDVNTILNGLVENHDKLDIIGARIRAFFPKQLKTIYEIIEEFFEVDKRKPFESDYQNKDELPAVSEKFGNYEGIHYWVRFKGNDTDRPLDPELWERFENHAFEIQVRSLMSLDGWAEVRHDIIYKALSSLPDRSERELLDTMKGAVKSLEVLLDHLLDVHEDRVRSDETKFESMELFEQALVRALHSSLRYTRGLETCRYFATS